MELRIGGLCDVSDKADWENTLVAGSTAPRYPLLLVKIGMEVFWVLITAGTGIIEGVLQMASGSLGGFIRS